MNLHDEFRCQVHAKGRLVECEHVGATWRVIYPRFGSIHRLVCLHVHEAVDDCLGLFLQACDGGQSGQLLRLRSLRLLAATNHCGQEVQRGLQPFFLLGLLFTIDFDLF